MRKTTIITALCCLGWTVKAQDTLKTVQLDEVVVTGTKSEIPVEKSGKSIVKLTRADIKSSGGRTVADLLNRVSGVQMDGNFGPMGTNIGYFIRGASSKRTLILIDGVPFNDPSGIDQTYDLRLLDLNQVESIEILKGGLSTLYGSGAAAGVINVTLKRPEEEGVHGSAAVEYGSFNTLSTNVNLNSKTNKLSYLVNGGFKSSDGFSMAQDMSGTGDFDNDGFKGYNVLGKLRYEFSQQFDLSFTGALDEFKADYDQGVFSDGDNTTNYRQTRLGLSPRLKWKTGSIRGDFFITKLDRSFNSPSFLDPNERFIDAYEGNNLQTDVVVNQALNARFSLLGGINFQRLGYSQPTFDQENFSLVDPYASLIYDDSNFNIQLGGRLNVHSEYGSNFVWNVNPSYLIRLGSSDLKLLASYASAFIAPSLFQLFGPFGSNVELNPEESHSVEGGMSILNEVLQLDAVYFHRKDNSLILFGADGYENADGEIETRGIELSACYQISSQLALSANYTYIDLLNDADLFRIPNHKYGVSLDFQPVTNLDLTASYLHTGVTSQPFFNSTSFMTDVVAVAAYDLVDIFASYRMQRVTISAALNNVFDEEYVAIYGFNSVGRNYTLGLMYDFN